MKTENLVLGALGVALGVALAKGKTSTASGIGSLRDDYGVPRKTMDEIINYAIDSLNYRIDSGIYGADLHNSLFNEDYYIIGRYQAEEWLKENGGVFNAIDAIKNYEQDNFGQVTTDLSEPERVVNMFVYILGEHILNQSKTLTGAAWDRMTTPMDVKAIIKDLKKLL